MTCAALSQQQPVDRMPPEPEVRSNLYFDYSVAQSYAKQLQMGWLGPTWLVAFDTEAKALGMTQEQVDMVFRHHLWHIRLLSDPQKFSWLARLSIAFRFLRGCNIHP